MSTYVLSIRLRPMRYRTNRRHNIVFQVDYAQTGETRLKEWQLTALSGLAMEVHAGDWEAGWHFFPASDSLGRSHFHDYSFCWATFPLLAGSGNTMFVSCSFHFRGNNNFLLLLVSGHLTFPCLFS